MLGRQRVRESLLRRGGGRGGDSPSAGEGGGGVRVAAGGGGGERGAGWVATVVRQSCPSPAAEREEGKEGGKGFEGCSCHHGHS